MILLLLLPVISLKAKLYRSSELGAQIILAKTRYPMNYLPLLPLLAPLEIPLFFAPLPLSVVLSGVEVTIKQQQSCSGFLAELY